MKNRIPLKELGLNPQSLLVFMLVILLGFGSVAGSIAYLTRSSSQTNIFTVGEVQVSIQETFPPGSNVKSNVSVVNQGNVPAYIRGALAIYWIDSEGNILPEIPVSGVDYTIEINDSDWILGDDGLYYYTLPVAPDQQTANLIQTLTALKTDPDCTLVADILTQAIQSTPYRAASSAWSVIVSADGSITPVKAESGGQ